MGETVEKDFYVRTGFLEEVLKKFYTRTGNPKSSKWPPASIEPLIRDSGEFDGYRIFIEVPVGELMDLHEKAELLWKKKQIYAFTIPAILDGD